VQNVPLGVPLKMASNKLSDRKVATTKAGDKEQSLGDGGGLWLRVMPYGKGGSKSWYFRYTFGGKAKRLSFGHYPSISLSEARKRRDDARSVLVAGRDPGLFVGSAQGAMTLTKLAELWRDTYLATTHKDGGKKAFGYIRHDLLDRIGAQTATTVTLDQMIQLLEESARRAPTKATKTLAWSRSMFSFGVRRRILTADPTSGLKAQDIGAYARKRTRTLSWDELVILARKIPDANLPPRIEAALWVLLATGTRSGELRQARVVNIDLGRKQWVIPSEVAKNGREHVVHLSKFAARWMQVMLDYSESEWLMTGEIVDRPVSEEFLRKLIGDRIGTVHRARPTDYHQTLTLPGGDWRLHDLRRTAATRMGDIGIQPHVIESCLNHVKKGIEGVYQQQEYLTERQKAFEAWGSRLRSIALDRVRTLRCR